MIAFRFPMLTNTVNTVTRCASGIVVVVDVALDVKSVVVNAYRSQSMYSAEIQLFDRDGCMSRQSTATLHGK
jgi:hypothetical protein